MYEDDEEVSFRRRRRAAAAAAERQQTTATPSRQQHKPTTTIQGKSDESAAPAPASEKSGKRRESSRLKDPEFAAKHKAFLQKVSVATNGSLDTYLRQESNPEETAALAAAAASSAAAAATAAAAAAAARMDLGVKRRAGGAPEGSTSPAAKRRKNTRSNSSGFESQNDCYCWICHKEGDVICCETCPRVFHLKCIQLENAPTEDWVCPECVLIMTAENMDTRSRAMRLLTVDQLCLLLKHALARMRSVAAVEPFLRPVDPADFPAYKDYVTCPMDLSTVERNVKRKQYGSTEAFLADTKWILHNCIIFNSTASKLTSICKALIKVCKHEMQEIENCPDCYLNAHVKKECWFVAACRIPHLLVWAKLKGFPFWPGKAMRVNSEENVDVRFFGAHDRAWIPLKDVFLYSSDAPTLLKNKKKGNLDGCVHEVELYIKHISEKFGKFEHAPQRTAFDPRKEEEQIKILYPACTLPFELGPTRRRARTFSFSGSERSHTATPTPSEIGDLDLDACDQVEELPNDDDINKKDEEEEVEQDNLQESNEREEMKSTSTMLDADKASAIEHKDSSEPLKDSERAAASPPCEVSSTTAMDAADKNSKKQPAAPASSKAALVVGGGETAPAGSTVAAANAAVAATANAAAAVDADKDVAPAIKVAVIAETSEQVIIEGDDDMEEEDIEEIDDVEPDEDSLSPKPLTIDEPPIGDEQKGGVEKAGEVVDDMKTTKEKVGDSEKKSPTVKGSSEEDEIDDVEPEAEDDEVQALDTSRLLASGVSVTVIDKKPSSAASVSSPQMLVHTPRSSTELKSADASADKSSSSSAAAAAGSAGAAAVIAAAAAAGQAADKHRPSIEKVTSEIGLGSDISVTVVQKKKIEQTTTKHTPKISVKKESELLENHGHRADIVSIGKAAKKSSGSCGFPPSSTPPRGGRRTSIEETAADAAPGSKAPPDPIVTISKVQGAVSAATLSGTGVKDPCARGPPNVEVLGEVRSKNTPPSSSPSAVVPRGPSPLPGRSSGLPLPPLPVVPRYPSASLASILGAPASAMPKGYPPGPPGGVPAAVSMPGMLRPVMRPPTQSMMQRMGGPVGPVGFQPRSGAAAPVAAGGGGSGGLGVMPSLHPRPVGPLSAPPPLPAAAGPVSEQLNKVATKLVDFMRGSLEDLFREMAAQGSPEATIKALQIEMEKLQWRHQQELAEVKHNTDLILMEMRQSMEADKQKTVADIKKQAEIEKQKVIAETKKKQWCANCGKEAIFYCCWNTSYCDYPCQQSHWPSHMSSCAQNSSNQEEETSIAEPEGVDPTAAAALAGGQHFLTQQQQQRNHGPRPSSGMVPRNLPGAGLMPFASMPAGINPRMMNQIAAGLRFPRNGNLGPSVGPGGPAAGMRFPGNYF